MIKPAKLMILIACGFLFAVFFVPLWHIQLQAPQYPGGLDMYIWIDKITGTDEFTLQNINILNHYIGMQEIEPDSFKELRIMPYVVAFFILTGLVVAFLNKRKLTVAWVSVLVIGGTIGLIDFYLWQQAFGNELDPQAPIKVVGMSYSPPFLGVKTLLNIKASSFPHWGGLFFGLALASAMFSLYFKSKSKAAIAAHIKYSSGVAASLLMLFSSCKTEPQAIDYGFDACAHCKMTIADQRYGSELVTKKGKVYKFDAIECLAAYQQEITGSYAYELVTDFVQPGEFIDAQKAWFLQSEALPSPMGMNLNAFANQKDAAEMALEKGGVVMDWGKVKQLKMGEHNRASNE